MNSGIVVQRSEAQEIKKLGGWILIAGRRKVGKTYLIKNFLNYDAYFLVKKDRSIHAEGLPISRIDTLDAFVGAVKDLISNEKCVVIDEFQRLPLNFLEEIATLHPHGKLVLSGSSLRVMKEIFGEKSPLLGLVQPYILSMAKARDVLDSLVKTMPAKAAIEIAPYVRDPWTIPIYIGDDKDFLYNLAKSSKLIVPALIREIFTEEDRELTNTYSSILALIGAGTYDYSEIANILYTRGILKRQDTSLVIPYIRNMEAAGILEGVRVYGTNKKRYRLSSAAMELFYYIDSRYDLEERDVSFDEMAPALENIRNLHIENFLADLLAETLGGRKELIKSAGMEIDILITKRNKPVFVGEVKWGKLEKKDVENFIEKTRKFSCRKAIIFKTLHSFSGAKGTGIDIISPDGLVAFLKAARTP